MRLEAAKLLMEGLLLVKRCVFKPRDGHPASLFPRSPRMMKLPTGEVWVAEPKAEGTG